MPLSETYENKPVGKNYAEEMKKFLKNQSWSVFYVIPPWLSLVVLNPQTKNSTEQNKNESQDKKN